MPKIDRDAIEAFKREGHEIFAADRAAHALLARLNTSRFPDGPQTITMSRDEAEALADALLTVSGYAWEYHVGAADLVG